MSSWPRSDEFIHLANTGALTEDLFGRLAQNFVDEGLWVYSRGWTRLVLNWAAEGRVVLREDFRE